jgi:hypothetical protein
MAIVVSLELLTDAQRVLKELRARPRAYRYLRKLLGNDSDRALRAIDRLDGLGVIRRCMINGDTHFECVPTVTAV